MPAEHGHGLLLRALNERRPEWLTQKGINVLEIGTTREPIPGQDSTRAIAEFCKEHGWNFTTCDMDPANGERARELFESMGVDFKVVTAKGEEYIANSPRVWDVVYLDAYDFDHGKHSEVRQERYEQFLGSRIDQHACEVMHLEAMEGLNKSGKAHCLVVIDDTWKINNQWVGKGPMAVPWAVNNGWSLTMESDENRAVVLEKWTDAAILKRKARMAAGRIKRRVLGQPLP